ncbi:MAG: GspE/PulE/PilB domain-containing protein [Desulfuromonadales bacterium]
MALKLGELLVNEKLITQGQLEEALQAQVIFGGKLGTILIEMGVVSEKIMAEALKQQLGFPCARPEDLEDIPRSTIDIISLELAENHKVIPVSVTGRKLTLAMADPRDIQAIDEIAFRTGYIILPMLALEVRLYFALERYYGLKRPMRYIAPPKQVRDELDHLHLVKGAGNSKQRIAEEEYLGAPGSEQVLVPGRETIKAPPMPASSAAAPPIPRPPVASPPIEEDLIEELDDVEVTLEDMTRRLVAAGNRDDVADALIEYLGAHYARAVLFMVVGGQVTGWRAAKHRQPIPAIDQFQLPLSEPSVLKTAVESNSFFLGPIPPSGANLALTTLLGKPAPTTALLLPLSMLGRVVGLICIDDPEVDMAETVTTVQKVAGKALLTFELLILHSKILRT